MTKFVRRTAATVIAAAAIVFMTPVTEAWAQGFCRFHYHTGFGTGNTPALAQRAAFRNWRLLVIRHDGAKWATPCRLGKRVSCTRAGFRLFRCTFRARPSRVSP